MPTSPNLLAGLSNAPASTTIQRNNYASGYPIENVDQRILESIGTQTVTSYTFPLDLPKYHFVINENEWSYDSRQLKIERQYRLQLPTPLTDSFEVEFGQDYSYLGDLFGAAGRVFGQSAIGQAGQAIVGGVAKSLGLTLNTFKTVTMSAPNYRTFDFTWKFSPKNLQEARAIRKITFLLRKNMSPRTVVGDQKILLQFPKIYTMYFSPNVQYLYKFKPCVLTAITVDYQGGNPFPGFYKGDVNPSESIVMSTKWLELEYWLSNDLVDLKEDPGMPTDRPFDNWNYYTEAPRDVNTAARGVL